MLTMQGDDSDMDDDLRIEEEIAREEAEHVEREQEEVSGVDDSGVEFLGQEPPNDETDALPIIQATVDLKALAAENQTASVAEVNAKSAVKLALEAKHLAEEKKKDAYAAKEAAFTPNALTAAWKAAIKEAKDADDAWRAAKDTLKQATAARKQAWATLYKARRDAKNCEAEVRMRAAESFQERRKTLISAPTQATEGLKPWNGCPGVTVVRIASARLPALDGHEETDVNGRKVVFEPLRGGSTVTVVGTGGGKTFQVEAWLKTKLEANPDLPVVVLSARINIAQKADANLRELSLNGFHNYKNKPAGVTMEEWLKHSQVIISIEQVEKLESWISMYKRGILIFDECVTGASSIVNGVTVHHPARTARTLAKLADAVDYLILMDADFDGDAKGKVLLQGIAPLKPVLFVQTTVPSLPTTILYAYSGIPEEVLAYAEWREHSCRTSSKERHDGTSPDGNRTYIGEDWPSDVKKTIQELRGWNVSAKALHGQLGPKIRKEALADLDAYVQDADAFVVTSVAGIGTDQGCKFSKGFSRFRGGDHAPGSRAGAQRLGRLNRKSANPLDAFTAPDGTHYPGGVIMVLLPGTPPDLDHADGDKRDPKTRAARKFVSMRKQVGSRRDAVLSTQAAGEELYTRQNATYLEGSDGAFTRLAPTAAHVDDAGISAMLADLEALDMAEDDDKQLHSYAIAFFEKMALPNRGFKLERIMPLGSVERKELEEMRNGCGGDNPQALTPDEAVGEMNPNDQYFSIKESVEADDDVHTDSAFWQNCYAKCVAGEARFEGNNTDEAYLVVFETLKNYKEFPPDEGDDVLPTSKTYMELYNDRNQRGILHRGMMRFLSESELMVDDVRGCKYEAYSDPMAGVPRPAHMLKWLQELAHALQLRGVNDLLEPQVFTSTKHEWLAAHNRSVAPGEELDADKAMARNARSIAIKLGCTGIRHGEYVKKPTTLLATVCAVLKQRCAMRPPVLKKNAARSAMHEFEVTEMAPGYAELGLHWHPGLHMKIPLGEYAVRDARWKASEAEAEKQRRSNATLAATIAMMEQFGEDEEMEEEFDVDTLVPDEPFIAPYNPDVLFVHYEDAALQGCLRAWKPDETQRKVAANALFDKIAERATEPGVGDDDAEIVRMKEWKKDLNRLETRHRIATDFDVALPPAAKDGPLKGARVKRESYTKKADGEGRRWAKADSWLDDDGKLRSATSQGMPSDLRVKLLGWKFADADGRKSDPTIYVILAYKLGLPRSSVDVLIDEYLISDAVCDKWHSNVAAHYGVSPGIVKRWPNIFGNGGVWKTCLEKAELPPDIPQDERVKRMESKLRALRWKIVKASRDKPGALWPGSEHFVDRHDARLQGEMPHLSPRERGNKVFSYLIGESEDKILSIHMEAQRSARREAIGPTKFDTMTPEQRDTGSLAFDGLNTERVGEDPKAGNKAAGLALVNASWHAQSWGIEYKIEEKPMFGEQDVDPNEFDSAKGARRALREACAAYPEVQQAVDNPPMYRHRALPVAGGNASVIPVSNGRALLTIEVRKGKKKYGLFGGKAEPGETLGQTAAREAFEESGRTLSDASRNAISQLEPAAFKECRPAFMRVAVAPVGVEDDASPSQFVEANANRAGSSTKHVGIEWVDLTQLLNYQWHKGNMHDHQCWMVVAVRETLQKYVVSGNAVCGEKRSRDALLDDIDDDTELEAAMTAAEGGA